MNTTAPAIDVLEALTDLTDKRLRGWGVAAIIREAFPCNTTGNALEKACIKYGDTIEAIQKHLTRTVADAEKSLHNLASGYSVASSLTFFCTANDHDRYSRNVATAETLAEVIVTLSRALGINDEALTVMFARLHGVQK